MNLSPLILEPQQTPAQSSVIWLHGLGATQRDFESIARYLQQSATPNTRYILPQAPTMPVTLNAGYEVPAWYDLIDLKHPRTVKIEELDAAAHAVSALIDAEVDKGISPSQIFLAGFSQGGAVVLHTAYVYNDEPLGGVLALSTYFPTFDREQTLTEQQKNIPSIHLHGTHDNVVPIQYGKEAYEYLKSQGVHSQWFDYPMSHEASQAEIDQVGLWLNGLLSS